MSNFQFNLPQNMVSTWKNISADGQYSAQDHARLKQAADANHGTRIQEYLETQAVDKMEQALHQAGGQSFNLKSDVVEHSAAAGHATVTIEIVDAAEAPSDADLDWATALEAKIEAEKYTPSSEEVLRYQKISDAFVASRANSPEPSAEELGWATNLQAKVQEGYQPSPRELSRFRDISARLAIQQQKTNQEIMARTPDLGRAPSSEELEWAQSIHQRTQTGYQPTEREVERFQMIIKARQTYR